MKIQFLKDHTSTFGSFTKGHILDYCNEPQIKRWVSRGLVSVVDPPAPKDEPKTTTDEQPDEAPQLRKAVARKVTNKAVTR